MIKNKKDFNILKGLVEEARLPLSTLAKKTGLSREVVQYRLKQLEKEVILGYRARINLRQFVEASYIIFLNVGLKKEEALPKLKQLPFVHWIGHTGGRWNYVVGFSVDASNSLKEFLDLLFALFEVPLTYSLVQQLQEFKDTVVFWGDEKKRISHIPLRQKASLDLLDVEIIELLCKNARWSNAELGKRLKVARETIRLRIKRLEQEKIILNYRTILRLEPLGLESYSLAIKCKSNRSKDLEPIARYLAGIEGVSFVCSTAGDIQFYANISTRSFEELDKVCTELRSDFSEVQQVEPLPLFLVGQHEYLPSRKKPA